MEIEIPSTNPNKIHLICENESQDKSIMDRFMIFDKQFEVFKALSAHEEVVLKLRIYYKNIFGSGFLEEAQYLLAIASEQDEAIASWREFIGGGINAFSQDIIRFESLVLKLPDEAHESIDKVNKRLETLFDKDLQLEYFIKPDSFSVKIVSFEESLEVERLAHMNLLKSYHPDIYNFIQPT
ncbi:MAG: hypothetical protein JRC92_04840 [Deltaproteobacteria bacterium]|nr:hypothetical protein [Deltaproteobacteria bacterium]